MARRIVVLGQVKRASSLAQGDVCHVVLELPTSSSSLGAGPRGPKGDKGDPGERGPQGLQGEPGVGGGGELEGVSEFAQALLGDADAAAMRTRLELGSAALAASSAFEAAGAAAALAATLGSAATQAASAFEPAGSVTTFAATLGSAALAASSAFDPAGSADAAYAAAEAHADTVAGNAVVTAGNYTDAEVGNALGLATAYVDDHAAVASDVHGITAYGATVVGAANAAAARSALSLAAVASSGSAADLTGTLALARLHADVVLTGDARLSDARTPLAHTQTASTISDSTAAGRAVLTAADATAQRTALGLASIASSGSASDLTAGTVPIARIPTGTTGSTVALGNAAPNAHAASHVTGSDQIATFGAARGLVPASPGGTTAFLRADGSWATPSGGGGSSPREISLGAYVVLTNIAATYDGTNPQRGLGHATVDMTDVTSIEFTVQVNKIGTGTQSWQLWNETDGAQIGVISDAAGTGNKTLSQTFSGLALSGVKRLRVRALSTVNTDDPVYYGASIRLS